MKGWRVNQDLARRARPPPPYPAVAHIHNPWDTHALMAARLSSPPSYQPLESLQALRVIASAPTRFQCSALRHALKAARHPRQSSTASPTPTSSGRHRERMRQQATPTRSSPWSAPPCAHDPRPHYRAPLANVTLYPPLTARPHLLVSPPQAPTSCTHPHLLLSPTPTSTPSSSSHRLQRAARRVDPHRNLGPRPSPCRRRASTARPREPLCSPMEPPYSPPPLAPVRCCLPRSFDGGWGAPVSRPLR